MSHLKNWIGGHTPGGPCRRPPQLGYYPLTKAGERFPVADPTLQPALEPRPSDDALFLHGLLEGVTAVEARAYSLLAELGASPLTEVR